MEDIGLLASRQSASECRGRKTSEIKNSSKLSFADFGFGTRGSYERIERIERIVPSLDDYAERRGGESGVECVGFSRGWNFFVASDDIDFWSAAGSFCGVRHSRVRDRVRTIASGGGGGRSVREQRELAPRSS